MWKSPCLFPFFFFFQSPVIILYSFSLSLTFMISFSRYFLSLIYHFSYWNQTTVSRTRFHESLYSEQKCVSCVSGVDFARKEKRPNEYILLYEVTGYCKDVRILSAASHTKPHFQSIKNGQFLWCFDDFSSRIHSEKQKIERKAEKNQRKDWVNGRKEYRRQWWQFFEIF